MDPIMDVIKNSEEPEWLEKRIVGELRLWQIMFLCLAGVTSLNCLQSLPKSITCNIYGEGMPLVSICKHKIITRYAGMNISVVVMVCCCFRFRIPRTKQQIEADYKRRKITTKFRHQLETIQDSKMDTISLKDALELLHEKTHTMEGENQSGSQPSSIISPQQSSLEASFQPESGEKPDPQTSGLNFVKFATKVAHLSKLGQPKSPTSPTSSDNKMEF